MNEETSARILVTGGCGFIGSHLVDRLSEIGFEVFVVDDLRQGEYVWDRPNIQYFFDDVSTSNIIEQIPRPLAIIHLANSPRVRRSFDEPRDTIDNNITTTTAVADWARHWQTYLFFATSSSTQYKESVNPYTWSKAACESILDMYEELYDLKFMKMFFYNVYGPREPMDGDYATVVAKFGRQYKNGEPMTVVGDGTQSRDFTHVNDICSGLLAIIENKMNGEVVNLGRGNPYSIMDLVKMYAGESAKDGIDYKHVPKRKNEGQATKWSETIKLNWKPTMNLPDYIEELKKSWEL